MSTSQRERGPASTGKGAKAFPSAGERGKRKSPKLGAAATTYSSLFREVKEGRSAPVTKSGVAINTPLLERTEAGDVLQHIGDARGPGEAAQKYPPLKVRVLPQDQPER